MDKMGVTVLHYVDYSTKYGMGYLLSNGCMGAYFNDSTILTVTPTNTYIYIDNPAHHEKVSVYSESTFPVNPYFLKKKTLFTKFKVHLNC
jgi:hypothetical protein